MELGLIGLGETGQTVAAQLLAKTHHNLLVYDPDGRVFPETHRVLTAAELFSRCETIFLTLESENDLLHLLNAAIPFRQQGQMLIDLTRISPALAHKNANALRRRQVQYLDCGIFTAQADLSTPFLFFVGGSSEAFQRVQSLLRCVAPDCRYMGPSGRGQAARVICGAMTAELEETARRCLSLASGLGMSPECFTGFAAIADPLAFLQNRSAPFSPASLEQDKLLAREMEQRAKLL